MASIGGGYVWPRLSIWGEGRRIGLMARSDPSGVVGPVRYVTDALLFISDAEFDKPIDTFLKRAVDEGLDSDRVALKAQFRALEEERRDPEIAKWRRLEAQLGFDPDEGPEPLLQSLASLVAKYGDSSVEEAIQAHPGHDAVDTLNKEINIASNEGWDCDFSKAVLGVGHLHVDPISPPWRGAEEAARRLRKAVGVATGRIDNTILGSLANISQGAFAPAPRHGKDFAYGLRFRPPGSNLSRIVFRYGAPTSRRFELSRAIGDAVFGNSDSIGPLARSKTARQKFQRAFAQSLLCPFDELLAYINTSDPTDDDITAAADHFDVSERVVRTTLINKNVMERENEDFVEAA
jgi:hypothetical protein